MRLTQRNMKVQIEEDINIGGVTGLLEDKVGICGYPDGRI